MPNWKEVLSEIQNEQLKAESLARGSFDAIRRKYLSQLHDYTGRNLVAYYSGWQSKQAAGLEITDEDRNGFMMMLHELDCSKGLDIILHTPGGSISATQSIVNYLIDKFEKDIRVIIPHTAMSAGTIIACSCREIYMAKHSSIGPIDPQIGGMPASGILAEFERAHSEMKADPSRQYVWAPILQHYTPTLLGHCQNAIDWSEAFAKEQLGNNMFSEYGTQAKNDAIEKVITRLTDYNQVKTHERQINYREAIDIGLNVKLLEDDQKLQDLVLTVHHCYMHTLSNTPSVKIMENHSGVASIKSH